MIVVPLLVAVALTAIVLRPLLARLPEPADAADKLPYAALATPVFLVLTTVATGVAVIVPGLTLTAPSQPLWWVLAVGGCWLAAIDLRTTWLPYAITRISWLAMALAAGTAAVVADDVMVVIRSIAGAALAGGLYWLIWRLVRRGFGFGDVRFAPLIAAPAAAHSWSLLYWALLLGSAAGAAMALMRLTRRRSGEFPYAPAMLAGPYLACLIPGLG